MQIKGSVTNMSFNSIIASKYANTTTIKSMAQNNTQRDDQ